MELESSIACYLEVRMTLKRKHGVLQLEDIGDVQIRLRSHDKDEAYVDVTEAVVKSKDAVGILESIGLNVFEGSGGEKTWQSARKQSRLEKSFKE